MSAESKLVAHRTLAAASVLVERGRHFLSVAERERRERASFDPTARHDETADDDWAVGLQMVSMAMHHLDESVPNGQLVRTRAALGALFLGLDLAEAALLRRGAAVPVLPVQLQRRDR